MKILMLTDRLDVGGAETHIAELATALKKMGETVEILSSGGRISDRLEAMGITQHRMPLCTRSPLRLLILRRRMKRLIKQNGYDVLHAHARIPAFLLRGIRMTGISRIVTVHARFHANRALSKLCFWGDRTIAVSEDLRSYVCDTYGLAGDRVSVIPNGIDCKRFAPIEPTAVKEPTADEPLRILFASRLDKDCSLGAELLCKIAPVLYRTYPKLTVGIVGNGNCAAQIRSLAEAANHSIGRDCIHLYGQVEDMAPLLRTQNIFIGVSRAAMEAAASGCAIILCGNEGYLGILDQATAAEAMLSNFCCRGSDAPSALRLECDLRHLLDRPTLRRKLGAMARELICTEFNVSDMASATHALYLRTLHPPYRHRLLVGGYFGCGNAGDDGILLGFLEGMHQIAPDVQIQALTAAPHRAEKQFGIRCVHRKNPVAIKRVLGEADMFVCGGGSLLQNTTSNRSLHYYLTLLRMAKRAKCITVLYAAGIGPIYGKKAESKLKSVLSQCDYISLRDPDSLRYLSNLGLDRSRLHESADPALLLPLPSPARSAALLRECDVKSTKRRLCVILRQTSRDASHLWKSVIIAVRILCRRYDLQPLILLFCQEDVLPMQAICDGIGAVPVPVRGVGDLAALLRDSHGILSMRLHALILAASSATPAIGLSVDQDDGKIVSFARLSGQPVLPYPRPSVGEIVDLAEQLFFRVSSKNDSLIADAVSELRKKAWKDLENIIEMLYNKNNQEG